MNIFKSSKAKLSLPTMYSATCLVLPITVTFQGLLEIAVPAVTSAIVLTLTALIVGLAFQLSLYCYRTLHSRGFIIILLLSIPFFSAIKLFMIRTATHREITWNVDWRMALSLANSARHDPTGRTALDYSGISPSYPATPTIIAGHLDAVVPQGIDFMLFLVIPVTAITSLILLVWTLGGLYGINQSRRVFVPILTLCIPYVGHSHFISTEKLEQLLRSFLLNPTLMIGTLYAISIIFSGLHLIVLHRASHLMGFFVTLVVNVALLETKPQFIPYFLVSVLVVLLTISKEKLSNICSKFIIVTGVSALLVFALRPKNIELEMKLFLEQTIWQVVFLGLLFLTIVSFFFKYALPRRQDSPFNAFLLVSSLTTIVGIFNIVISFSSKNQEYNQLRQKIQPGFTEFSLDGDIKQGFIILYIVNVVFLCLVIGRYLRLLSLNMLVVLSIFLMAPKIHADMGVILRPHTGYEFADTTDLLEILRLIPTDELIIVNDIADPSDNFRRPGRGEYWSSMTSHTFFLSSLLPNALNASDFEFRYRLVRSFFSSKPNSDDLQSLRLHGIRWILVNKRCAPNWLNSVEPWAESINFSLFDVKQFAASEAQHVFGAVSRSQRLLYGTAACL
jgi:hypothetical protein